MSNRFLCALGWHSKQKVYVSFPEATKVYCPTCGDQRKEIRGYYY